MVFYNLFGIYSGIKKVFALLRLHIRFPSYSSSNPFRHKWAAFYQIIQLPLDLHSSMVKHLHRSKKVKALDVRQNPKSLRYNLTHLINKEQPERWYSKNAAVLLIYELDAIVLRFSTS